MQQIDGNDSISSVGSSTNFSYDYALNRNHQSKRLLANAAKTPFEITYNNIQVIAGVKYATNVNVECNAGLYITAIKPILESVTEGWMIDTDDHIVNCTEVSHRSDNLKTHMVCTQLFLHISNKEVDSSTCKVVLHFYHT